MVQLLPGFLALTIFVAGLYPVFLLGKRTSMATLAAAFGLAVNLVFVFGAEALLGPERFAIGQAMGLVVVLFITGWAALRALPVWPSGRDIVLTLVALAAMAACVWPLSGRFPPALELLLQGALGVLVYGGLVLAFDIARCRTLLKLWLVTRKMRRAAAGARIEG